MFVIVSYSLLSSVIALHPDFYARISEAYQWIRTTVCVHSSNPSADFDCDEEDLTFSAAPTETPPTGFPTAASISAVPTYVTTPILLKLKLDAFPRQASWQIQTTGANPEIIIGGPYEKFGTYFEEIHVLRPDTEYELVILGSRREGINGEVAVYLGSEQVDDMILAYTDMYEIGFFDEFSLRFTTSAGATGLIPSTSPSESPSMVPTGPSVSPSPTYLPILIMVQFKSIKDSRFTGWRIERTSGQVVHEVLPGFFRGNHPVFLQGVEVNEDEKYRFIITDSKSRGFKGEAILFLGNVLVESAIVAYYDGPHGNFYEYQLNFTASTDATIGVFPSTSPAPTNVVTFAPVTKAPVTLAPVTPSPAIVGLTATAPTPTSGTGSCNYALTVIGFIATALVPMLL